MPTKFDPKIHHRRSIRLPGYDYSSAGAYYVTVVTWHRECLFGEVLDGEMIPNKIGKIVQWEWQNLALSFKFVELGASQVMPNHFHGILLFHDVGATRPGITGSFAGKTPEHNATVSGLDGSPLPRGPKAASLGAIIGQFKSRVTKRLWKMPEFSGTPIWQRNYYEHIIRNEWDMRAKWDYILANPALWDDDDVNPRNLKSA
jgi:REP element-mobilizing transposase RayT